MSYPDFFGVASYPEDDCVSSLERKQRKQQDRADVLAFYSSLGFVFFVLTGVLLWSEIYAFATHPDKALTVSFLLEVVRLLHAVWLSLGSLWYGLGELAWTLNAVMYGPAFSQQGKLLGDRCTRHHGWVMLYPAMERWGRCRGRASWGRGRGCEGVRYGSACFVLQPGRWFEVVVQVLCGRMRTRRGPLTD